MTSFLGLDLSLTETGLAHCTDEPGFTAWTIKPKNIRDAQRLSFIEARIRRVVSQKQPDLVAIEGYSMGSRGRVFDIGELGGVVRMALYRMQVPYVVVSPSTLKQYTTGKGNATKCQMLTQVAGRWHFTENDNEADAVALASFAKSYHEGDHSNSAIDFDMLVTKCVFYGCQ